MRSSVICTLLQFLRIRSYDLLQFRRTPNFDIMNAFKTYGRPSWTGDHPDTGPLTCTLRKINKVRRIRYMDM
jgi:hypothetical protein